MLCLGGPKKHPGSKWLLLLLGGRDALESLMRVLLGGRDALESLMRVAGRHSDCKNLQTAGLSR